MSSLHHSASSSQVPSISTPKPKGHSSDTTSGNIQPKLASNSHGTRYSSSAAISEGNTVKFHVSGCAYFWSVSEALLRAKESVWILGCMFNRYLNSFIVLPNKSRVAIARGLPETASIRESAVSTRSDASCSCQAGRQGQHCGI